MKDRNPRRQAREEMHPKGRQRGKLWLPEPVAPPPQPQEQRPPSYDELAKAAGGY